MLFSTQKQIHNSIPSSQILFRDPLLWPQDIKALGESLYHRTFFPIDVSIDMMQEPPAKQQIHSPLFYTFTEDLVESYDLRTLETTIKANTEIDQRFLLSHIVSDHDIETAALVTKIPFHNEHHVLQMLHLVFVEQRNNAWALCVEEPNWTVLKEKSIEPPPNWTPIEEGFRIKCSKNKHPKPIGLGNWFSKSRFFALSPLPTLHDTTDFQ